MLLATQVRRLLVTALAVSAVAAAATPAGAAATPIQLGAYYCPTAPLYTFCEATSASGLDGYKGEFGRYPDIALNYRNLDEPLLEQSEISDLEARAVRPMITVEPYVDGYGNPAPLTSIAGGAFDNEIRAQARAAKSFGGEVLVRFAHEMNGDWYSWGKGHGYSSQDYVNAWRRYVTVFRQEGAANARFVWAPNIDGGLYPFAPYFPGEEWVDYVALDGYNWGTGGGNSWQRFSEVFGASYAALTQLSAKPVIISETGSSESGGDKSAWIREAFLKTVPQSFPRVTAVVWFNRDFSRVGERDWRINTSPASVEAYRQVVSNSLYGGPDPAPTEEVAPTTPKPVKTEGRGRNAVRALKVTSPKDGATSVAPRAQLLAAQVLYRIASPAPVEITVRAAKNGRRLARTKIRASTRRGRIPLRRIVRRHKLRPGSYRVVARTIESDGRRSGARSARFRVS